jgi:hypothetical protein
LRACAMTDLSRTIAIAALVTEMLEEISPGALP